MFYIAESENQLEFLRSFKKGYVEIITSNDNLHPTLSFPVAIYLHPLPHPKGYIIPINHQEGLNTTMERVSEVLSSYEHLYTISKKDTLYHGAFKGLKDLSILYSMRFNKKLEFPNMDPTYANFYGKFDRYPNINQIIPLSKLHEYAEQRYNFVEQYLELEDPPGFHFYNNISTPVFYLIEREGIGIEENSFIEKFKPKNPMYNIEEGTVYTSYNLTNITSRPTNAFNSVNFVAIPKGEDFRKCFLPKNDYFVEFDFDGYHLRLIAEMVGYTLTEEPAHEQFAKMYFNKKEISHEDYIKAKQINFHAIYGKIPEEYKHLEFFQKLTKYIKDLWKTFENQGYIEDPISGRHYTVDLPDMNPPKLMSYLIQSVETSRNVLILKELLKTLQNKKSKIILYTYDAIIIDFSKEDTRETLEIIEKIMSSDGKYPVKFKYSKDLGF